jgi:hypothetical protein
VARLRWRPVHSRPVARRRRCSSADASRTQLGWAVVSAVLLRRRLAAGVRPATSNARSIRLRRAGRSFRARATLRVSRTAMNAVDSAPGTSRRQDWSSCSTRRSTVALDPWVHPWLRARGAGERRPVHAWRTVGCHGLRGAGATVRAPGN